jgi:DNA (cytosine-5)-methyltransferase 1
VRFEGRVAKGVPDRVNKLRALGNAVVPQIPELIGRAIMSAALEPKS